MKTSKTRQASSLPSYSRKSIKFLSPLEMAVFHHFSFTKSDTKSSRAFNLTPEEFQQLSKSATDKMHIFFERFKTVKEEVRLSIYPPKGKNRLIGTLGLSTRVHHCLLGAEIHTIGQLSLLSEYDLNRIRGISAGSISEIKTALKKHKLKSPLLR
jgi:DNA-directed RNA polymerase alpha subunit